MPNLYAKLNLIMSHNTLHDPIIVALASDDNVIVGLVATMTSVILATDKEQRLDFHLLDTGMSAKHRDQIVEFFIVYPNVTVVFHTVDVSIFEKAGAPMFVHGWSAYARILLHKIIPDERCVYIDIDFLVLKDLREIWATDLHGFAFAACTNTSKGETPNADRLGTFWNLESTEDLSQFTYHNSGFLFINLDFWRDFGFAEKAIELLEKYELCEKYGNRMPFEDQGILNYIFRGKIKTLSPEWNYTPWWTRPVLRDANYHFTSQFKPWSPGFFLPVEQIWWAMYNNHIKPRWDVAKETRGNAKRMLLWLRMYGIPCIMPVFYCFLRKVFKSDKRHRRENNLANLLKMVRKTLIFGPERESKDTITFYRNKFKNTKP